jgi:hypothetical protein
MGRNFGGRFDRNKIPPTIEALSAYHKIECGLLRSTNPTGIGPKLLGVMRISF